MDGSFTTEFSPHLADLRPAAQRILEIQNADGGIAWFEKGPWDPWNHVESAMALAATGHIGAAIAAYDYLLTTQREDGAWFGEYGNALPMVDRDFIIREPAPAFLDSNFCAYPAVGIAHYFQVTGDLERVRAWWHMVKNALDFVLTLQRPDGTISWAFEALGTDQDDALLAGNASIAKSLECGIFLAQLLHQDHQAWHEAHTSLTHALRATPDRFDKRQTGARFAMDWYYPVLAGVLKEEDAVKRILDGWTKFVIDTHGCRCVSDEPWVTAAESAELVLALLKIGHRDHATRIFEKMMSIRDDKGVFWMGWQTEESIVWPREQPSWTQAAIILAADALRAETLSSQVLTHSLLKTP
ncbi:MAG: prenyltransferase/squalene oxidase repeat-containing protein [Pseudomonadota bacterium]